MSRLSDIAGWLQKDVTRYLHQRAKFYGVSVSGVGYEGEISIEMRSGDRPIWTNDVISICAEREDSRSDEDTRGWHRRNRMQMLMERQRKARALEAKLCRHCGNPVKNLKSALFQDGQFVHASCVGIQLGAPASWPEEEATK